MTTQIEVQGHSGCDIRVARENNQLYIYKSTQDPKYFKRLVLQAEKQQKASLPKMQFIRVPEIHSILETENEVVVKMDYVYSRNFVEFFEKAGFEQVNYLIEALIMYLEKEIEDSSLFEIPSSIITEKFEDVMRKSLSNRFIVDNGYQDAVSAIIREADTIFKTLPESLPMPVGVCHGDLTFSNILFNGNNYYLIDFLDSFIESPLLDIVKIRQDTAWQWSRLMYSGSCDDIRLKIAFCKIDEKIHSHFNGKYDWYRAFYKPMQLMNFLRILQYAHEPEVTDFLINALNSQLNEF